MRTASVGGADSEHTYDLLGHSLRLRIQRPANPSSLTDVLRDLSAEPAPDGSHSRLSLTVLAAGRSACVASHGRVVFRGDGLTVRESPHDVEVTDGDSALTVRHEDRECLVSLGESFADKPSLLQRNFWAFAIAKLLRTVGLFALHGAGVIGANGVAALLVGPSGSGKSTLAIGLAQAGWQVLSDDALVLRQTRGGIEALGLRKKLYIDGADSDRYAEFGLTPAPRDRKGGARFQLDLGANTSTSTNVPVTPRFLVFPTISRRETSQGRRIDAPDTVGRLLEASGPQLLDRALMEPHLEVLSRLAKQAVAIDLQSGADLHKQPERLVELLDASASSDRECGLYPQQANT